MQQIILYIFLGLHLVSCQPTEKQQGPSDTNVSTAEQEPPENTLIYPEGNNIVTRFHPPEGYERIVVPAHSFAGYLHNLELKPMGSLVLYYDQTPKNTPEVYISVINMEIGTRDLQQCADAVMRLRGEYLFAQQKYNDIHFNFVSDGKPRYFKDYANGDYSYQKFRKYMDYVFSYANTRSLYHEMVPVENIDSIQTGDIFIQTGNPFGHAVIVVDMAIHSSTGKKIFLLAQSYMPAQEIQVLINPQDPEISPWYEAKRGALITPEWIFSHTDLRRFPGN